MAVHVGAAGKVVRVLGAAMQHQHQPLGAFGKAGRHEQAIFARPMVRGKGPRFKACALGDRGTGIRAGQAGQVDRALRGHAAKVVQHPLQIARPGWRLARACLGHIGEWGRERGSGPAVTAVATTGIYCRPSCPARTPLPHNVSFFSTAAAAQGGLDDPGGPCRVAGARLFQRPVHRGRELAVHVHVSKTLGSVR